MLQNKKPHMYTYIYTYLSTSLSLYPSLAFCISLYIHILYTIYIYIFICKEVDERLILSTSRSLRSPGAEGRQERAAKLATPGH